MKPTDFIYPLVDPMDRSNINLGIDLRTHLASLAMQGLLADKFDRPTSEVSERAVMHADSLIEELNKPQTK